MVKFSARKPLTIFVAVLAILILGVVAFTKMTPDLLPNMDFPYVVIMTTYPGASPETVEEELTKPLEQSMATLEHIDTISSTSSENYSVVILAFEESVNMDTVGVDIQQKISALQGTWDDTVGTPYVLKINPSLLPVEVAAVSMEDMDVTELTDFVENTLEPKLEGVSGVASITVTGGITKQVHAVISQEKIDTLNARLADRVNEQLDEARSDLEETKQELEDAQEELEDAQAQIDSGKSTLVTQTAEAQATIQQKTVEALDGKMQIQQQLVTLQETRTSLTTSVDSLRTASEQLHTLLDSEQTLTAAIDAMRSAVDGLTAADGALQGFTDALALIDGDETLDEDAKAAAKADILTSADYLAAQQAVTDCEAALAAMGTDRYGAEAQILALEAQLSAVQSGLTTLDASLASMGMDRDSLDTKLAEAESGLAQTEAGIATLNDTLDQIDAGTLQLSEALSTLSETQSSGLLSLADAAAQLAVNSAAVNSALEQVDAGLDSIDDSREDALDTADLSGKLTMSTVASLLSAQDFSMPAGYVEEDGVSYMVSVGDRFADMEELEDLLLFDTGEDAIGPVYLSDVADIFVTDNADETYAKLNGDNGVVLVFEKRSTAATAEVSDALSETFDELEEQYEGLSFVSLMDQGEYIYLILDSITESLLTGAIFAVIILFLFLRDIRPTVITLVSIPVSVVFAVVLMYFTGVTLNMISLSGLAVAVGMLVDNSIVVIENIYRLRSKGATALQAAVTGAKQVAGAVTASTLTTVCVFLPIVFVEGITRQLFTDLALTMSYSLMASLIIALTLVPAMAKGMLKKENPRLENAHQTENFIYRGYRAAAGWGLQHKWVVLLVAVALLVWSALAAVNRGFSYMPDIDMNTVSVTVTMPEDVTRDEAVDLADTVLERIQTVDNVDYVGAMMGGTSILSTTSGSYDLTVYVGLPEGCSGAKAGKEIAELCADLPCEVDYDSAMMDMSYLSGSGITLNLYGEDMEDLQNAASDCAETLAEIDGVTETSDGLEDASPALHVAIDREKAMEKGYTVAQIYMELASALTDSTSVMTLEVDGSDADVSIDREASLTREELENYEFTATDSDGEEYTFRLSEVAALEDTTSLTSIGRSDQRRYISVTAVVDSAYSITNVTAEAVDAIEALAIPEGISYEFSGENETILEALRQLVLMLLIGVALVYFIMVAQFQSLKEPFIVMFTIPLAFTGGFLGLLICGLDVSILSMIGFIMLTGIIVNNGIVLVDYVNQLRQDGMDRREALVEAGVTRMRPILMTSLTTILGLIVMALGKDAGTALMQPVAVVCIGGLLYATAMTLFVVPCIYDLLSKKAPERITDEDMDFDEL